MRSYRSDGRVAAGNDVCSIKSLWILPGALMISHRRPVGLSRQSKSGWSGLFRVENHRPQGLVLFDLRLSVSNPVMGNV